MRTLRLLSLCSGIGVIDYVWSFLLGQDIAGQIEIDPYCTALLTKRWPAVPKRLDIKEVATHAYTEETAFGDVDVVAGGIPCQPFSDAGKRQGTHDDRYLWPYAFSIVQHYRPTWVLIENVAGFVRLALDLVHADLESADYQVQAYVLPACAVGAPHARKRCFIVAHTASSRRQERQEAERLHHQSDPSSALAHATGARETAAQQSGRGYSAESSCQDVAHTNSQRLQIGNACPAQGWACLATDGRATGQPQPRMGRGLDGFAEWLDSTQWPSAPGELQHAWESTRTVTAKVPQRAARLKALGNAIVPQQIYPFLRFIVEYEHTDMEVSRGTQS